MHTVERLSCNIGGSACRALPRRLHPAGPQALGALAALGLLGAGCVPAHRHPSWATFELQRQQPHDGLAVVSQPDGYGLHIWLDTDTRESGICQPRWSVDAARLFNGNGTAPFSSGLASREEFFAAVARQDVRRALKEQSEALCRQREPRRSFRWLEPPRNADQVQEEAFPMLEEPELLSDPGAIEEQENQLLNPAPSPQTSGSATRQ
jgi:hypothetical protein